MWRRRGSLILPTGVTAERPLQPPALRRARALLLLVALLAPSALAGVGAWWLARSRVPVKVELSLTTERVEFVFAGNGSADVLGTATFRTATVTDFERVKLTPGTLERASEGHALDDPQDVPVNGWAQINGGQPLTVHAPAADRYPAVTLEPLAPVPRGRVDALRAAPGALAVLAVSGGKRAHFLSVRITGGAAEANFNPGQSYYLHVENGQLRGAGRAATRATELLRATRAPWDPLVRATARDGGLGVSLELDPSAAGKAPSVIPSPLLVTNLDVDRQGPQGERLSALLADGSVRYLDYPSVAASRIAKGGFLSIDPTAELEIGAIAVSAVGDKPAIVLEMIGRPATLRSGIAKHVTDHRLSRLDLLRNNPGLVGWAGIVVWVFGTTLAAWRLWKELKV